MIQRHDLWWQDSQNLYASNSFIVKQKKQKLLRVQEEGFPGGTVVRNPPANAGDTGSSPGPGRSHMLRSS